MPVNEVIIESCHVYVCIMSIFAILSAMFMSMAGVEMTRISMTVGAQRVSVAA